MAFEYKPILKLDCDCKQIELGDLTLEYNGTTNPTGYCIPANGGPNIQIANITQGTATFKFSDGTLSTVDLLALGAFTTNQYLDFVITNTMLGLGGRSRPDGRIEMSVAIRGSVNSNIFRFDKKYTFYSLCQVRCCLLKLNKEAVFNKDCDDCKKNDVSEEASLLLLAIESSAYHCNDFDTADMLLKQLQQLCVANKCNGC